jgi:hypothetical protein
MLDAARCDAAAATVASLAGPGNPRSKFADSPTPVVPVVDRLMLVAAGCCRVGASCALLIAAKAGLGTLADNSGLGELAAARCGAFAGCAAAATTGEFAASRRGAAAWDTLGTDGAGAAAEVDAVREGAAVAVRSNSVCAGPLKADEAGEAALAVMPVGASTEGAGVAAA